MEQLSSENAFRAVEFAENPEPRVPCVLIVDTSTSMQGPRIDELNKGLQSYRDEINADALAAKRVEVAIVTFGGRVTRLVEFTSAKDFNPPKLAVIGGTPMGEAITTALDMILDELSVRKPLWLQGTKFRELFSWLSNSQQTVSRSSPGEEVPLEDPTTGPRGWARI
jgi:uncharacterized protein YegL